MNEDKTVKELVYFTVAGKLTESLYYRIMKITEKGSGILTAMPERPIYILIRNLRENGGFYEYFKKSEL
jgi:hypothetical protein